MFGIIGIVLTFAMVFGGYILAGGKMGVITHSLPFEMMMIGGAAVGSYLLSNDTAVLKHTVSGIIRAFKGPRWHESDNTQVLCLLFQLLKLARANPVELEEHVENPQASAIFQAYPAILADDNAVTLITDTLRSASLNYDDPYQVEDMLTRRIGLMKEEALHVPHALQNMADALPALGIVAAVLGVVKTMGSIDQPPAVLGGMIGSALVGTFLGVLLAYGIVGPMAARLKSIIEADAEIYQVVRRVILASLRNQPQPIVLETARTAIRPANQPDFTEVFEGVRGK